jgi:signal transduction histidine kinase
VPVIGKNGLMGILAVYRQAPQAVEGVRDDELISAFADQAAIALDNAERLTERKRAEEHLRRSREQLRALATKLQSIREEEKSRIARDLHDELGQTLTALKIHLRSLESAIGALGGDGGKGLLDRVVAASALADETVETVHRIAVELRPGTLDHLGLGVTLQQEARRFEQRTGIRCDIHVPEHLPALEPELATALYRICQEAMTNVSRHAEASRVAVRLDVADRVTLEVDDDGRGFDFASLHSPSLGLLGMIERARALGGEVTFQRGQRGTVVSASIPFPSVPRSEPPPAAAHDVPQGVPPKR